MDCHAVLYKQLSAWFLHGTVLDFNREFFICQQTETATETGAVATDEEPGVRSHKFPFVIQVLCLERRETSAAIFNCT